MWRAFFFAFGINLIILGGECLLVEKVVLTDGRKPKTNVATTDNIYSPVSYATNNQQFETPRNNKTFKPKDWMPWSLLAAGSIIVIYTYSLPRRRG
jgi:hypothetical protein